MEECTVVFKGSKVEVKIVKFKNAKGGGLYYHAIDDDETVNWTNGWELKGSWTVRASLTKIYDLLLQNPDIEIDALDQTLTKTFQL